MKSIHRRLTNMFGYVYLSVVVIIAVFPIYWLFLTAFKHEKDWSTKPPVFFTSNLTLKHFEKVFADPQVVHALSNTIIVAVSGTLLAVLFGAMAAYPLARIHLGRYVNSTLLTGILLTRLFPFVTLVFPYFLIIRNFRMMDTLTALIISDAAMFFPFAVWMMVGFYQGIPREMEEAAMIDGCSIWQRFRKIVLPVSINGLSVTAILVFMAAWNEFLYAVTFSNNEAKTLPVVIGGFISDKGIAWGDMTAISVISIVPVLLIVLLAQKLLVRGITVGSVK
ncbi:carbohydrate ABC transporter permease [Paenibacillus nasutitermitis]|uniref:ABC transporter permease n=1 Tax=Paenibacillus nasutitermitis TaxID=1652958 RepID=A0A916ZIZ5_9BACL|nr:carbohydrate ABC transporter permease [Paenibacillus nasutitermitis]GGD99160.1 ABC transporter permease [Paenibacillus nasutitermitis]